MGTIFTKIIKKEIPSYTITENEKFISFLDINPLTIGHCLVVPKIETDYFFDLDESYLKDILIFSKQFATMVKAGLPILEVLGMLRDQLENPGIKEIIEDITRKGGSVPILLNEVDFSFEKN